MLVWINGAFGAGKTHTAFELARRCGNAHVADPELIGYGIHKVLPAHARRDFQDRPQWRSAVVATLADAVDEWDGPVIVPMTLVDADHFDEIMAGLADRGVDVTHVSLSATPATLQRRLRTRSGYWIGRVAGREETWAMAQIDRCVEALAAPRFAVHVPTDGRSLDAVVETIAALTGLTLRRPPLRGLRRRVRRVRVGLAHIRW
ncbi:AAA family ATPase [Gordonia sp. NB41Y]|uniref:AAA family ATPase n=1 Tax=Gordonia sp. NB41Y TaxID=875808 RepID=UPI0006B15AA8|nr:AAA family ATPase [Gordonia sp. NB41Y]EMP11511.2 ATP-binding protein [Gordonia sp. NB41Y]WLP91163.1 AAA family ATPase [Gordonia sp. NB41Y]